MKSYLIKKYLFLLLSFLLNLPQNDLKIQNIFITSNIISEIPKKINGITIVAPPKPIDQNAFSRVKETENNWVAFVPYGFGKKDDTSIRYNLDKQWWGEKSIGIESCILNAHKVGFKVMLKPQIFIWNGWVGDINFDTPLQWENWEKEYRNFIMTFVHLASKNQVEMFCIGTELNISIVNREKFWRQLIIDIRKVYKGKLVYSANWDHYDEVKIWNDLDYIGLSSYFPLSESINPNPTCK